MPAVPGIACGGCRFVGSWSLAMSEVSFHISALLHRFNVMRAAEIGSFEDLREFSLFMAREPSELGENHGRERQIIALGVQFRKLLDAADALARCQPTEDLTELFETAIKGWVRPLRAINSALRSLLIANRAYANLSTDAKAEDNAEIVNFLRDCRAENLNVARGLLQLCLSLLRLSTPSFQSDQLREIPRDQFRRQSPRLPLPPPDRHLQLPRSPH